MEMGKPKSRSKVQISILRFKLTKDMPRLFVWMKHISLILFHFEIPIWFIVEEKSVENTMSDCLFMNKIQNVTFQLAWHVCSYEDSHFVSALLCVGGTKFSISKVKSTKQLT